MKSHSEQQPFGQNQTPMLALTAMAITPHDHVKSYHVLPLTFAMNKMQTEQTVNAGDAGFTAEGMTTVAVTEGQL